VEACFPEDDDAEMLSIAIDVFRAHCVMDSKDWLPDGEPQSRMLTTSVSYTHLRAQVTGLDLGFRPLLAENKCLTYVLCIDLSE